MFMNVTMEHIPAMVTLLAKTMMGLMHVNAMMDIQELDMNAKVLRKTAQKADTSYKICIWFHSKNKASLCSKFRFHPIETFES